jgi:peroxiredoxin
MGIGGTFFNALLSDHVYDELTAKVTGSRDLGLEDIDEKTCRHLRFEQIDYDWDAWIETTNQPLIRKVSFQIKKFPESVGQELPNMKMSLVYGLNDWELDPKLPEDEFAINPPEEWTKVDNLTAEPAEAPHALVGKPAPEFELEKRGGGKVDLAQYRDKDVVILDFWATWCPPCVKALPTIGKVAEKYRDKGVVFYAVDLEETPDDVEQFLKDQKLDIPVLFDSDNAVAKLYQVSGIPQTVLIGKDGTVQVVHVGLKPDLENLLSGELDDLLAGKDLATAGQEAPPEK